MTEAQKKKPSIVLTTDVNGTTTPHNTFAELVRPDGLFHDMESLVTAYTTGVATFSAVLPQMRALARRVDRSRLETYARNLPLYPGVTDVLDRLLQAPNVDARIALSTTGFAGLMALVNRFRHRSAVAVAASPVLVNLLTGDETSCLIRPVTEEREKVRVIEDLCERCSSGAALVFHVGDTLGDYLAIRYAAEKDGIGIAFNPNAPLRTRISQLHRDLRKKIAQIRFEETEIPDFARVGAVIEEALWKRLKTSL